MVFVVMDFKRLVAAPTAQQVPGVIHQLPRFWAARWKTRIAHSPSGRLSARRRWIFNGGFSVHALYSFAFIVFTVRWFADLTNPPEG